MSVKLPMNLSIQECDDIWSALVVFRRHIGPKKNPETTKAINRLIVRVRAHIKKCHSRANQLEKVKRKV